MSNCIIDGAALVQMIRPKGDSTLGGYVSNIFLVYVLGKYKYYETMHPQSSG